MHTKICKQCGVEKELDEFYVHKEMKDGHLNICKECKRAYQSGRPDKHKWTEKRKQDQLKYQRRRRKEHPEKESAHRKVHWAIKTGELIKPEACEECGKVCILHAHHDDYSKPLDVIWLCPKCHKQKHNRRSNVCKEE